METLVSERDDLMLRKIDIVRWDSPVALQYRIDTLPTLYLYDGRELVSKDTDEVMRRLSR